MPPETNPRLVFERLFGDIDTSLPPEVRARRLRNRRSILDLVGERTKGLSADLGPPTAASSTSTSPRSARSSAASRCPRPT
jgi:hypothetical protein